MEVGKIDTLIVKSVVAKTDGNGNQKSWPRRDGGMKYLFSVFFDNGYEAEYAADQIGQNEFIPGKPASFKCISKKNGYPDTIAPEIMVPPPVSSKPGLSAGYSSASVQGHPCCFALSYAITHAGNMGITDMGKVLEIADDFFGFLLARKNVNTFEEFNSKVATNFKA